MTRYSLLMCTETCGLSQVARERSRPSFCALSLSASYVFNNSRSLFLSDSPSLSVPSVNPFSSSCVCCPCLRLERFRRQLPAEALGDDTGDGSCDFLEEIGRRMEERS